MKRYDVQDILIAAPVDRVLALAADAPRSPEWIEAFASVDGDRAILRTSEGEVEIGIEVVCDESSGTVDWRMRFPDGSLETAYSRALPTPEGQTVFTFVLMPSAAILQELEGDLDRQSRTLAGELRRLKELVERGDGS